MLDLPQAWATQETSTTLALSADEAAITAATPGDNLVLLLDWTPLDATTDIGDNAGELDTLFETSSQGPAQAGYTVSETTPITVDGSMGLQADLSANGGAGRLVVIRAPAHIVRILAQATPQAWAAQQSLFDNIVASIRFPLANTAMALPTATPEESMTLQPIITKNGPPGFLIRIGSNEGAPDSRFTSVRGLDAGPDGTIYLAESSRGIWMFSPDGSLIRTFGEDILMSGAYDVALGPDDHIYVADYAHNSIVRFSPSGALLGSWGGSGDGQGQFGAQSPQRIAVGADGSVYALDNHVDEDSGETTSSIVRFQGENGSFIERINLTAGLAPNDLAVDTLGNLYIADASNSGVFQIDKNGTVVKRLGDDILEEGITAGAIDIDRQGNIYVATWSEGILQMTADGELMASGGLIAKPGTVPSPGEFSLPNGIAAAPGNAVWVSDNSGEYSAITALRLFPTTELNVTGDQIVPSRVVTEGGYLRQWAIAATASSSYGEDYGPDGVTGPPDVEGCKDSKDAWASATPDTVETLEVEYETPVFATQVNIYQNHQPGFVSSVEVLDERGRWSEVYSGTVELENVCPYKMEVTFEPLLFRVVGVKLTIDQRKDANWSEIDAVELIGAP